MFMMLLVSFTITNRALILGTEVQIRVFHKQQQTILENWFEAQRNAAVVSVTARDIYDSVNYYLDAQAKGEPHIWDDRNNQILLPFLERVKNRYGFDNIVITNTQGKVISATDRVLLNEDLSGRDFFKKALMGQTNTSAIFYYKLTNQNCMVIATPIYSNGTTSGMLNGVMLLFVDVPRISATLTDGLDEIGKTADAFLFDANQTLLTMPRFRDGMEVLKTKINTEATAEAARAVAAGDSNFQRLLVYRDRHGKR